ncbi:MAG: precorrin-3B C(17)-methyltransferase, partial [Pseudomonadota bacterium]
LADKHTEPPVLALAEDASAVVPLLGGHHGANDLARQLADVLDASAAITTAGDLRLGVALDVPPAGWQLAPGQDIKSVVSALLAGAPRSVDPELEFLSALGSTASLPSSPAPTTPVTLRADVQVHREQTDPHTLVYHPRQLIVGVGCDRGCPPEMLADLVRQTLSANNLAPEAIGALVSIDRKADEAAVHALAADLRVPARFFSASDITAVADLIPNPSDVVLREVGVPGVAEGAALAASAALAAPKADAHIGARSGLRVEKYKNARATVAIADAGAPIDGNAVGRARGTLRVIGLGPGAPAWRTPAATAALARASDWVGYGLYLDLAADCHHGQILHTFDLGAEEKRVRHAMLLAAEGRNVALICSGDAGIYAMAALVFEALENANTVAPTPEAADWLRRIEIDVVPGVSAFQAAAARLGAPIGHDFCCISLSDLLTPWPAIEQRLHGAAVGDFVVSFYNPRSKARRTQLSDAMAILAAHRPPETPVAVATNLGRPGEKITVTTLAAFNPDIVDMLSLVMVGSSQSRKVDTPARSWIFTPRGYAAKAGSAL